MNIRDYIQTLRKYLGLIAICTVCAASVGLVASILSPEIYQASVLIMSNQTANSGIVDYNSLLGGQRVIETYRILLKTQALLEEVVTNLDLPYSARALAKGIEVQSIPDTQLLELTVEDTSAERAAEVANEIAFAFLLRQSAEKQLRFIEAQEQAIIEQMGALEQAIDRNALELDKARGSASVLTQDELTAIEGWQLEQRSTYAQLVSSYLDIRAMQSRLLDVIVVEPAVPPPYPVRPRTVLNTGVAGISGCIIALVTAFAIEYFNDNFETADDVRKGLNLPTLGAIPFFRPEKDVSKSSLRIQEDWGSAEAFRILRTNLEFTSVDHRLQTVLITSPAPGEGKTNVTASLGTVIAQAEHRVLLVDADLHRPRLHEALHKPNQLGLTSLLRGDSRLEDCIQQTDTENLFLLPSGPMPPNPSDLLRSRRMTELIKEFEGFADTILFDSPPVLSCSDPMILGSKVNGTVLVLDKRTTQRHAASRAIEALDTVDATVLGCVLNNIDTRSSSYYYYHSDSSRPDADIWKRLLGITSGAQTAVGKAFASLTKQRTPISGD